MAQDYTDSNINPVEAVKRLKSGKVTPLGKCTVWVGNDWKESLEIPFLTYIIKGGTCATFVHGTSGTDHHGDYDDSFTPAMAANALKTGNINPITDCTIMVGNEWITTKLILFLQLRANGEKCIDIIHGIHDTREKDIWHQAANVVSDTLTFIGSIPKKIIEAIEWVVLAPFKGAMKHALDTRKIKHSDKLEDIADRFYMYVIQKKPYTGNFERPAQHFAAAIMVIIQAIIDFFKTVKDKGAAGKPLTDEEKKLLQLASDGAKQGEAMIKAAQKKAADELAKKNGTYVAPDNKLLIIIAIVFLIMFFKK